MRAETRKSVSISVGLSLSMGRGAESRGNQAPRTSVRGDNYSVLSVTSVIRTGSQRVNRYLELLILVLTLCTTDDAAEKQRKDDLAKAEKKRLPPEFGRIKVRRS